MNRNDIEWKEENQWLQQVLKEAGRQYEEKRDMKEKFKRNALETQRQLWQDVGSLSISNGLEQIVDFMEFIDAMKIQKRRYEFTGKIQKKYERMLQSPYFSGFSSPLSIKSILPK
jgi:DNA helicase-2/ATP-dependent DNA helicase PcrA